VPPHITKELNDFKDSMFTVNSLFLNFDSTDLARYDAPHSKFPDGVKKEEEETFRQQFVLMMCNYLNYLKKSGMIEEFYLHFLDCTFFLSNYQGIRLFWATV
jgi:hypothetical protein